MKQHSNPHRHAIAMLLAAVALPATPLFAQDIQPLPVPAQTVPPPVATTTTPAAPRVAPPSVVSVAPAPAPVAEAESRAAAPQRRSAERPASRPRVREVTPAAPVTAAAVAAPAAAAPALTPVPAPVAPAAETAPQPIDPVATGPVAADPVAPAPVETGNAPWLWLVLGLAVIGAIAGLLAWRRRRETEYEGVERYFDGEYEEPAPQPVPAPFVETVPDAMTAAAPVVPAAALHVPAAPRPDLVVAESRPADPIGEIDKVSVGEPDSADIDAMAAASEAPAGRPWLELMMRPMRAGTNRDDAIVEFELTVSNAGDVPARDVRISTWMFAAGSQQESEMEQLLIDPPAGAKLSEVTLAPGDGTRIEAAIALPNDHGMDGSVLPVLVADARYALPGGGEGRTSASFEIGLARGEAIEGFSTERPTGMHEDIDARLHAEPQHA